MVHAAVRRTSAAYATDRGCDGLRAAPNSKEALPSSQRLQQFVTCGRDWGVSTPGRSRAVVVGVTVLVVYYVLGPTLCRGRPMPSFSEPLYHWPQAAPPLILCDSLGVPLLPHASVAAGLCHVTRPPHPQFTSSPKTETRKVCAGVCPGERWPARQSAGGGACPGAVVGAAESNSSSRRWIGKEKMAVMSAMIFSSLSSPLASLSLSLFLFLCSSSVSLVHTGAAISFAFTRC